MKPHPRQDAQDDRLRPRLTGMIDKRHEFGTKVTLATTIDDGFVIDMRALPGNPYGGHTLSEALEQVEILTGQAPALAVVNRGYRGHGVAQAQVLISSARRGLSPAQKRLLRRRSAIAPEIGRMKTDGRLSRWPLEGTTGAAIFAILCGCDRNVRKILPHLRDLWADLQAVFAAVMATALAETSLSRYQNGRPTVCSA